MSVRKDGVCVCPSCGVEELRGDGNLNMRMFKNSSDGCLWSQCLVCAGYYDTPRDPNFKEQGWFTYDIPEVDLASFLRKKKFEFRARL